MAAQKMIYVSADTHQHLRLLAARRNRTMGAVVAELVEDELGEFTNIWTQAEGLRLQERALGKVWADPELDVYDED